MVARAGLSWFNISVVLALCSGGMTYGYVVSIIATTLGQPNFYAYFDLTTDPADSRYAYTNSIIGAINGLLSAGGVFGAIFMAWSCEALGRKRSLVIAAVTTIVGAALQAGSVHIAMFLTARFLTGMGIGMLITLVPLYQAEVAPPASRGFLVAQTGVIIVVACTVAAWVGVGSYYSANPVFQWRFPLSLQALWPMLTLALLPIIPESPRWLLFQGRREEAWRIIAKLHGNTEASELFAREEFYQMSRQVEADKTLYESEGLLQMLRKSSHRKRFFCAFMTMFAAQATGNMVINNYSVILYKGLGQTGAVPLILSGAYCTYSVLMNYLCSLVIDRIGRVRLIVVGLLGCVVCLCIESALVAEYAGSTNQAGLGAGVFFLFAFITFYAGCIDATTYVYCSEIFPTHIRSKGMAFSIMVLYFCTIPFLEAAPTAFATIGWKYYLVFIGLTTLCVPIIGFTFPETKGLSLEEINEKFGESVEVHLTQLTDQEKAKLDMALEKHVQGTAGDVVELHQGKAE